MLRSGRIDAAVADYFTYSAMPKEANYRLRYLMPPFALKKRYFIFSPGKENLKQNFDKQLKALLDNGFIDGLYRDKTGSTFKEMQSFARTIIARTETQKD